MTEEFVHEHINTYPGQEFPKPVPEEYLQSKYKFKMMYQGRVGDQVHFVDSGTLVGQYSLEVFVGETDWWELGEPQSLDIEVTAVAGRTMSWGEAEVRLMEEEDNVPLEKRRYPPIDKDEIVR